jgi:hypothetical protein
MHLHSPQRTQPKSKERLKGWGSEREPYSNNDGRTRRKRESPSAGGDGETAATTPTTTGGPAAVQEGVFPRHCMGSGRCFGDDGEDYHTRTMMIDLLGACEQRFLFPVLTFDISLG